MPAQQQALLVSGKPFASVTLTFKSWRKQLARMSQITPANFCLWTTFENQWTFENLVKDKISIKS